MVKKLRGEIPELFFASSSPRFEKWYVARDHSSGLAIMELDDKRDTPVPFVTGGEKQTQRQETKQAITMPALP